MSVLVPPRRPSHEVLDDARLSSSEMSKSLEDLAMVNRFCASSRALAAHIAERTIEGGESRVVVLDVGAGAGDEALRLARRLRRRGLDPRLIALDLQWRHLAAGLRRNRDDRTACIAGDAFRLPFEAGAVDWTVSTLVFHHFAPEENVAFLRELGRVARRGFAVVDLRRHVVPLFFVAVAGRLFFRSSVSILDGVASVRQAYTPDEAREISRRAVPGSRVRRVFPFRLLLSGAGS